MADPNKFQKFVGKRILIYGTGKYAERCIDYLKGYNVVGVVDRVRYWGDFCGIPILMWDSVNEETADVVIVAALKKNVQSIYNRIFERCIMCHMEVYSSEGLDLVRYWGVPGYHSAYKSKEYVSESVLRKKIESYDAISFDIFDTLIMRKVLEPADLFDLVEYQARMKGVNVSDFRKIRREAELRGVDSDIYGIYKILHTDFGVDEQDCQFLLAEELLAEERNIIPRNSIIGLMQYALELGKKVTLISDMYLPTAVMCKILENVGITGYDTVYISCDYGVGKGNGLFEKYKSDVNASGYLHIGDNLISDGEGARKSGIDFCWIPSAYDMFCSSSLEPLVVYASNYNEKTILGMMVAELFQDPFSLCQSDGKLLLKSGKALGKLLFPTMILLYLQNLEDILHKKEYAGVLFAARDGYLIEKIYHVMAESGKFDIFQIIPAHYIAASRKLCVRTAMKDAKNIACIPEMNPYRIDGKKVLQDMFGIHAGLSDMKIGQSEREYYLDNQDGIINMSNAVRERYCKYFEKSGIELNQRYLYCDLNSTGTSQYGLSQIFQEPVDGYYLIRYLGANSFDYAYSSCYEINVKQPIHNSFMDRTNLLEMILSSPQPSIIDIDEMAEPIYADEKRSKDEISFMECVQSGILDFLMDFVKNMYLPHINITKGFAERVFRVCDEIDYGEECEFIATGKIYDDFMETYRPFF